MNIIKQKGTNNVNIIAYSEELVKLSIMSASADEAA